MSKILLVLPRTSATHEYPPIYGMLYVSSYLKSKGVDVRCLNLNHYLDGKLGEVLDEERYDIVCTGGMFVHYSQISSIFATAKKRKETITILGGPIASADPEYVMQNLQPDYLVLGEGELSSEELIKTIQSGGSPENILGIAYRGKNNETIINAARPVIEDIDSLPYMDFDGFELGHYLDHGHTALRESVTIDDPETHREWVCFSTRGCPMKCTFCFQLMGGYRARSIDKVIEEIQFLVDNYQVNRIVMADDLFAINNERVLEFCQKISPLKIGWECQMRVATINEDLLATMKRSGCRQISYGLESASPAVLKSMKKGVTVSQIERALDLTQNSNMTIQGNFLFGDPAETLETINETISFLKNHPTYLFHIVPVLPYPGSAIHNVYLEKSGGSKDACYSDLWPGNSNVNLTDLSNEEFNYLRMKVSLTNSSHKYARLISKRKLDTFYEDLRDRAPGPVRYLISAECPLCKNISENALTSRGERMMYVCKHCYQRSLINPFWFPGQRSLISHGLSYLVASVKRCVFLMVSWLPQKYGIYALSNLMRISKR